MTKAGGLRAFLAGDLSPTFAIGWSENEAILKRAGQSLKAICGIIFENMDRHDVKPAEILKAIRDDVANDFSTLDQTFAACSADRHLIRDALGRLEQAGLVAFANGRYTVTESWMKIQGTLGVSLTNLIEAAPTIAVSPYFGIPRGVLNAPDLFVLMSFASQLKPVYDDHIAKVASQLRLSVKRADDFFTAHAVIDDIWAAIYHSRAVIADCTGRNANVFYEIGLAHTVGKPVILITQAGDDVPFDLKAIRYIEYTYTPPGMRLFEERLYNTLKEVVGLVTP